jgi:inner membrane protein YidH
VDEAPDPRYLLANERTLLAYERTAIGLMVAAVGALNLLDDAWPNVALGVALLLASAMTAGVGWHRYRQAERAIRAGTDLPSGVGVQVVVLAVIAIIVVVGLTVLV